MKPNFALSLSFDGISLLQRAEADWSVLGHVSFQEDDLAPKLGGLKARGLSVDPSATQVKLVIPNEQIKYLTFDRPKNALIDDIEALIIERLKTATPYQLSELRFDWATTQDTIFVAAVAIETLQEAEAFAQSHEFKPLGNVAIPPKDCFIGEAFFGTAEGNRRLMECDEQAIAVVHKNPQIADPGPHQPMQIADDDSTPVPAVEAAPEDTAPDPDLDLKTEQVQPSPAPEVTAPPASTLQTRIMPQVTIDVKNTAGTLFSSVLDGVRGCLKWTAGSLKNAARLTGHSIRLLRQMAGDKIRSAVLINVKKSRQKLRLELVKLAGTVKEYRAEFHAQQQKLRTQIQAAIAESASAVKQNWQQAKANLELSDDLKQTLKPFWPVLLLAPALIFGVAYAAYSIYGPQASQTDNPFIALDAGPDMETEINVAALGLQRLASGKPARPGDIKKDTSPKITKVDPLSSSVLDMLSNTPSKPETVITDDSFELGFKALERLPRVKHNLSAGSLEEPPLGIFKLPSAASVSTFAALNRNSILSDLDAPDQKPVGPTRPSPLRDLRQPMPEWPKGPVAPQTTKWDFLDGIYHASLDPTLESDQLSFLPQSPGANSDVDFDLPSLLSLPNSATIQKSASILASMPVAPVPPADMGWDYLGDLYIASIDPMVQVFDAIALPAASSFGAEPGFIRPSDLSISRLALGSKDVNVVEQLPKDATTANDESDELRRMSETGGDEQVVSQEVAVLGTGNLEPEKQAEFDASIRTPVSTEVDLTEAGSTTQSAQGLDTAEDSQLALLEPKVQTTPLVPDKPEMVPEPSAENVPVLTVTGIPLVTVRPPQRPSSLKTPEQKAQEELAALALLRPKARTAEAVAAIKPAPSFEQPLFASLRPKSRPLEFETTRGITFLERLLSTISEGDEAEVGAGAGTEPSNALVRKQATLKAGIDLSRINLIGVFGISGKRRALIQLKNGRRMMVEVGDRLDGGRVAAIAKTELRYIKSGENITLLLPRG